MQDELTKLLFDRAAEAVVIYEGVDGGSDFVFVDINPTAAAIEKVRRDDIVGRRVTEVFPGVTEFGLLDVLRRVFETGIAETHPMNLYRDSRSIGWRENHVVKLQGGDLLAVFYEDKTDLRGLLDSVFGFIGIYTTDGLLIDANAAPLAAANLTRHDVIGKPFWETYWWSHSPAVQDQVRDALVRAGRGETVRDEFEVRIGDSDTIVIDAVFGPLRDQEGRFERLFGFGVDISAQKRAEQALVSARDDAEQANRAKSDFLAGMSHDLRTPLNAILGFAGIIGHQYFGPVGEKNLEYVKDIETSGEILLSLVNDILDLSAIEAGKKTLLVEDVDVGDILRECEMIVAIRTRAADVRLMTEIPPAGTSWRADRRAIRQILLNLLSNAVKFTPSGGEVRLHAREVDGSMVFTVEDTGRGMTAERLEELTEPFVTDGDDQYVTQTGWGLGLFIVKSLVELHGGELEIDSRVGVGTTVTVSLPDAMAT